MLVLLFMTPLYDGDEAEEGKGRRFYEVEYP